MFLTAILGASLFFISPYYLISTNPFPNYVAMFTGLGFILFSTILVFKDTIRRRQWIWSTLLWALCPLVGILYSLTEPTARSSFSTRIPRLGRFILFAALLLVAGVTAIYEVEGYGTYSYIAMKTIRQSAHTATMATAVVANPDPYPPYTAQLVFTDPLVDSTQPHPWDSNSRYAQCQPGKTALDVTSTNQNLFGYCLYWPVYHYDESYISNSYANFVFETSMTIIKGNVGGIVFRYQTSENNGDYVFTVSQDGTYDLGTHDGQGHFNSLYKASSSVIKTGLEQTNRIAVVALGSSIGLYVNGQLLQKVTNTTYVEGLFGILAENTGEVLYNNARLWTW
jgi:hypothetical protein